MPKIPEELKGIIGLYYVLPDPQRPSYIANGWTWRGDDPDFQKTGFNANEYPGVVQVHKTSGGGEKLVKKTLGQLRREAAMQPNDPARNSHFGKAGGIYNQHPPAGIDWKTDFEGLRDGDAKSECVIFINNFVVAELENGEPIVKNGRVKIKMLPNNKPYPEQFPAWTVHKFYDIDSQGKVSEHKGGGVVPLVRAWNEEAWVPLDNLLRVDNLDEEPEPEPLGFLNQNMIDLYRAAFHPKYGYGETDYWNVYVVKAEQEYLAEDRYALYTGPVLKEIPNLTEVEWRRLQSAFFNRPLGMKPNEPAPDDSDNSDGFNALAVHESGNPRVRTHETFRKNAAGYDIFRPSGDKKKGVELRIKNGARVKVALNGVIPDGDHTIRYHKILSVADGAVIAPAEDSQAVGQYLRSDRIQLT